MPPLNRRPQILSQPAMGVMANEINMSVLFIPRARARATVCSTALSYILNGSLALDFRLFPGKGVRRQYTTRDTSEITAYNSNFLILNVTHSSGCWVSGVRFATIRGAGIGIYLLTGRSSTYTPVSRGRAQSQPQSNINYICSAPLTIHNTQSPTTPTPNNRHLSLHPTPRAAISIRFRSTPPTTIS